MLLKYVALFAGFNLLSFAFVLWFKKSPTRSANRFLGLTFLCLAVFSFIYYYINEATTSRSVRLLELYAPVDYVLCMFIGPGLYLHLQLTMGNPLRPRSWGTWVHALPALPALVYVFVFAAMPAPDRVARMLDNFSHLCWQSSALNALFYVQLVSYLVVGLVKIRRYLASQVDASLTGKNSSVRWHYNNFRLGLVLMIISAPLTFITNNDYYNSIVGIGVIDVQFVYIFVSMLWHSNAFSSTTSSPAAVTQPARKKAPATNPDEETMRTLDCCMAESKVYLGRGCTLQDVADLVGMQPYVLSSFINNQLGKTFPEFINGYRIEYARQLLADDPENKLTIKGVSLSCGFGSKSTFNAAFKKHTGKTPSQFRDELG